MDFKFRLDCSLSFGSFDSFGFESSGSFAARHQVTASGFLVMMPVTEIAGSSSGPNWRRAT
jgi:hypothetical protein